MTDVVQLKSWPCVSPTLTGISNVSNGVKITWNASSGATKYRVFRKTGNNGWSAYANVTGTSYTDTHAVSGTTYTYTVRALDSSGNYASWFDETGKTIKYISAPVLTGISNTSAGVKLTWNAPAGAVKYRVFRKYGSNGWSAYANVTGTSYTDTKAVSGTTYTYTVRCIDTNGNYISWFDETGKTITYQKQ